MISDKSNVPKDENVCAPLIIPLEYQLTYPDCKSVKGLWDRELASKFMIRKKQTNPLSDKWQTEEQSTPALIKNRNFKPDRKNHDSNEIFLFEFITHEHPQENLIPDQLFLKIHDFKFF
jgi:hypothetical protein